jgi:hypothetical protein
LADHLTEKWLNKRDPGIARRAVDVLQRLIDYASIAETSVWLIQVDIARLASAAGDKEAALAALKKATRLGHRVIELRVAHDEQLAKLPAKALSDGKSTTVK